MEEIRVISADKDGADLRREKLINKYYLRAKGTKDDEEINEATHSSPERALWSISAEKWDEIFGDK